MYVGTVMHTELVTVPPDMSLVKASKLTKEKEIDHLLVVDAKGKLRGIVSDRDLKQSWASPATSLSAHELNYLLDQLTVEMIMAKKLITVTADMTIERAAQTMRENRINALPVMQDEKLVGLITSRDVMDILLDAIGIGSDSFRFTILAKDRIGFVAEVARLLNEAQISIRSIMAWPEKAHPGTYHIVMRVGADVGERAVQILRDAEFKVFTAPAKDLTPYLPQ
jgi:acetoin utilization protein AcuB